MLPLFIFLSFLLAGDFSTEQQTRFDAQKFMPLPIYPRLLAKVAVDGDYDIEMSIEEGVVKSIKVISSQAYQFQSGKKQIMAAFDSYFIESIENAVKSWHFIKQEKLVVRRLHVSFRSVLTNKEEPSHYIYRLDGIDQSMWTDLPTCIIIEYYQPLMLNY